MKATLFVSKSQMEIRLSNNVSFFAEEGESKEDFTARVTETVDRDYVDIVELDEFDVKKLKKNATKTLQNKRKSATGVELQIIQELLVERGALEENPSGDGAIYNGTQTDEDIPEEGSEEQKQGLAKGALDETPAEEKPEDKKEEKKEPRKLKKQKSDEDALAELEEAKKNKGRKIKFMCTKTKQEEEGVIKGVRLDKRNNFIQYRIDVEGLGQFGKGIDSEDLKLGDFVPVEEKETPETEETTSEESANSEK